VAHMTDDGQWHMPALRTAIEGAEVLQVCAAAPLQVNSPSIDMFP
jgi:hypothetical protein